MMLVWWKEVGEVALMIWFAVVRTPAGVVAGEVRDAITAGRRRLRSEEEVVVVNSVSGTNGG